MSSRLAREDWEDLSARSGGSGHLVTAPMLPLLFSSLAWGGWLRLGIPSPLPGTESDAGFSVRRQKRLNVTSFF